MDTFVKLLSGGHHNSLGNTEQVAAIVLADRSRLDELYASYFCDDEVVRLRVSSCMKRVVMAQPSWGAPYLDRLLTDVAAIPQASTQWTLANLFDHLTPFMDTRQRAAAQAIMQRNLVEHDDWIVKNTTMQVLADWAAEDAELRSWLRPVLHDLTGDRRKAVAGRANKLLDALAPP